MSTDASTRPRFALSFRAAFAGTVAVLVALAVVASVAAFVQGPRVTGVLADADASTRANGTRVLFTANVPLAAVDESQVMIEPHTPFSVDTSGRSVGVRLDAPLQHNTEYTFTVTGVTAVSGGPSSEFTTTLQTPRGDILLLERDPEGLDRIYRMSLDGSETTTVVEHEQIEDFRSTDRGALVSVSDAPGTTRLMLVRDDEVVDVALPGTGRLSRLQVADVGDQFGFVWTSAGGEQAESFDSRMFIGDLADPAADPQLVDWGDLDARVTEFRLIARSTSVLAVNSAQQLVLADTSSDGEATLLGSALWIDDIARSTLSALLRTEDGPRRIDLQDGALSPVDTAPDLGTPFSAEDLGDRGVLRTYLDFDDEGRLAQQLVVIDSPSGESTVVAEIEPDDALVQVCAAPAGDRVAIAVAPQIASNALDDHLMPIPGRVETRFLALDTGEAVTVPGFAASWCRVPAA